MKRYLIIIVLLPFVISPSFSQEIECEITTDLQQLPSEARDNLVDFVPQLKQYINSNRWTQEGIGNNKIRCTMNIMFQGSPTKNHYVAQVFIGSLRPVFKTSQTTAVIRLLDDSWEFDYNRYQPFIHNELNFDPLLSFVDFYMYLVLGYDFDTWGNLDGTPYFQKAADIVSRAHGAPNAGKGWDITGQSTYQRAQLIDELLNEKFRGLREAAYRYHYKGLDLLHKDRVKARKNIFSSLQKIRKLLDKINQQSQAARLFFDSKYLEIAATFVDDPDRGIYNKLVRIDPSHQTTYEEYSQKQH